MLTVIMTHISLDILKLESWTHMGCTAYMIIKGSIHIFVSISKVMHILLIGRRNRECCASLGLNELKTSSLKFFDIIKYTSITTIPHQRGSHMLLLENEWLWFSSWTFSARCKHKLIFFLLCLWVRVCPTNIHMVSFYFITLWLYHEFLMDFYDSLNPYFTGLLQLNRGYHMSKISLKRCIMGDGPCAFRD